jgi:hypothetical protein
MQQTDPIFRISVIAAIPNKSVFGAVRKEKSRTIKTVFLAKILDLLLRCRLPQDNGRGIAGYDLDQKRHQRHYRPYHQQHKSQVTEKVNDPVFHAEWTNGPAF